MTARREALVTLLGNVCDVPAVKRWFDVTIPDFTSERELTSEAGRFDLNELYQGAITNEINLLPRKLSVKSLEIALETDNWYEKHFRAFKSLHIFPLAFAMRSPSLRIELAARGWRDLEFLSFTHSDLREIMRKLRANEGYEQMIPNKELTAIILSEETFECTSEEEKQLICAASYWGYSGYLEKTGLVLEDIDTLNNPSDTVSKIIAALRYAVLGNVSKTASLIVDKYQGSVFEDHLNWYSPQREELYRMIDSASGHPNDCFDVLYQLLITCHHIVFTWQACVEWGLQNLAKALLKRYPFNLSIIKEASPGSTLSDDIVNKLERGEDDEGAFIFVHYLAERFYHDGYCSGADDEKEYLQEEICTIYTEEYHSEDPRDYHEVYMDTESRSWYEVCWGGDRETGTPEGHENVCDSEVYTLQSGIIIPFNLLSDSLRNGRREYQPTGHAYSLYNRDSYKQASFDLECNSLQASEHHSSILSISYIIQLSFENIHISINNSVY